MEITSVTYNISVQFIHTHYKCASQIWKIFELSQPSRKFLEFLYLLFHSYCFITHPHNKTLWNLQIFKIVIYLWIWYQKHTTKYKIFKTVLTFNYPRKISEYIDAFLKFQEINISLHSRLFQTMFGILIISSCNKTSLRPDTKNMLKWKYKVLK